MKTFIIWLITDYILNKGASIFMRNAMRCILAYSYRRLVCVLRWWTTRNWFEFNMPFLHNFVGHKKPSNDVFDDVVPHDLDLLFEVVKNTYL